MDLAIVFLFSSSTSNPACHTSYSLFGLFVFDVMAIYNVLLLTQIVGYAIGLIVSLCVVVPMSLLHADFNGHCLLMSNVSWNSVFKMMIVSWAAPAYCHYVLFVGGTMVVTCCIQIYRLLMLWIENRNTSFLSSFLEAVGCFVLSGLVASAAIIVTLGFITWCQSVESWFPSCEASAGQKIDQIDMLSTEWFYTYIDIAQCGAWAAFSTLVGLGVAATAKCLRHHQLRNMHAVLFSEREGERRPLLNSGWPEEGHSPACLPVPVAGEA